MPSADRLEEFAAIVAEGSISKAARQLRVPRATLSRRLAQLETELGVRLLHRRTRSLTLTPAGRELFQRARHISAQTSAAWEAVRQTDGTPRGLLKVSVSEGVDPDLFLDFMAMNPEVTVLVHSTPRTVDLVQEGIDVAIRYGAVEEPDLYVRRVAALASVVVGAPGYLDAHGRPTRPDDLAAHTCIRRSFGTGDVVASWPLWDGGTVAVDGRLATNDLSLLYEAALRGDGLAHLPFPVVRTAVDAGRLEVVLRDVVGEVFPVNLVYADRELIAPKVRAFVDHAAARLGAWFEELGAEPR